MALTKDEAMLKIQRKIDDPLIQPQLKRQLFSLYQNITRAKSLSPELSNVVSALTKEDDEKKK